MPWSAGWRSEPRRRTWSRRPQTGDVELDEAIWRLSADRREAFVLTQVTGLSYAEAAEVCGVPIGTIRSRVARARADLLDEIAGDQVEWGSAGS